MLCNYETMYFEIYQVSGNMMFLSSVCGRNCSEITAQHKEVRSRRMYLTDEHMEVCLVIATI
jgi:hypothetical protein